MQAHHERLLKDECELPEAEGKASPSLVVLRTCSGAAWPTFGAPRVSLRAPPFSVRVRLCRGDRMRHSHRLGSARGTGRPEDFPYCGKKSQPQVRLNGILPYLYSAMEHIDVDHGPSAFPAMPPEDEREGTQRCKKW